MRIRRARESDAVEMSKLQRETIRKVNAKHYTKKQVQIWLKSNFVSEVKKRFHRKDVFNFVAVDKGEIVGIIMVDLSDGQLHFGYIKFSYIGKGVGRKLIEYVEKFAKKKGLKVVWGCATVNSLGFYRKLGYGVGRKIHYNVKGGRFLVL